MSERLGTSDEQRAIYWLLRAYDSGHRKGWEPGPSVQTTMDGLHAFLCNIGYDPNERETLAWLREYERQSRSTTSGTAAPGGTG